MNQRRALLFQLVIILAVCAFLFFYRLGSFGLVGADEPRYAQVAREMFARHDLVVPTINGSPWLEKPPLLYWGEMLGFSVFGVHDWAARISSAALAGALALAIFFFMRRFRPGAELDAALIAASMAGIIGFGRGGSTDIQLTAPFAAALLAWWGFHETAEKRWLAGFYFLLAIGTLAKGPVAPVLALLIVGAYALARRDARILRRSFWWPGFAIFFAIALPWYVAVQIKVPEFFRVFFIQHNLERFGTNLFQHPQPFWYYIPVFLLAIVPWVFLAIPALANAVGDLLRSRHGSLNEEHDNLPLFLLIWIAIPILFFSISRSKLPGYILPAVPAAALLTADYLHRAEKALSRIPVILHALVCGALAGGALFAPWKITKQPIPDAARTQIGVAMAVGAVFVLLMVQRGRLRRLHFATLVPVIFALGLLLKNSGQLLDDTYSARPVQEQLSRLGVSPSEQVALLDIRRDTEYGLNFYRNQAILRYERDGIPSGDHVVIARPGSLEAIRALCGGRAVRELGGFPPQHLEFFLVSNAR